MKLRVSVELPQGGTHDVTLACDVTATVADTARALIRAGLGGSAEIEEIARRRLAPVTLFAAPGLSSGFVLLDPMAPIGSSGLQSGWTIRPVLEFGRSHTGQRLVPAAAYATVIGGPQRNVEFSLAAGSNLIGRDPGCRVHLHDPSVSRRHAQIEIDASGIALHDLGSANGIEIGGERLMSVRVEQPVTLRLGETELRITPGAPSPETPRLAHRTMHIRTPRVAPHFASAERELPSPPAPARASRIPVLAMLAPMLMGGAMYAITRSPMSLMMIAFSPLMMIGAWGDGRFSGRRRLKKETIRFEEGLAAERAELGDLLQREIAVRATETPAGEDVQQAIRDRGELLWTRRPEHRSFLEVRFGMGALPSRTRIVLPDRGDAAREHWNLLQQTSRDFERADPVPVIERLDRCGSIGVAGERIWAEGMTTSLVLQLVGLHSPYELTLACFAGPQHDDSWAWLKWLPHVDPVASPIPGWQLADSRQSSIRLITALEGLLESRSAAGRGKRGIRSHLDAETRNDDGQGDAVTELPALPVVIVLVLESGFVDPARLIELSERGPDVGIHLIWVARGRSELPAACRTFVELGAAEGRAGFVRTGTSVPLSALEFVGSPVAFDLARRLSPIEDLAARVLDESDLPKAVQLRELHTTDLLGGGLPVLQAWTRAGTIVSAWQRGEERAPVSLAAVVGQGADGPTVIDLRTHGPHALVGGTTGAGKSEFLQTWIMSMAASTSPDRLSFLLVDYKGGAAFAECVDLPHTVGLVTDLSPHLVRRALTSLRAELHYREELLAEHGAKDLITMERRSDPAAPPVLVIVIDEFAALAGEVPEFVDGVIDIAQRGRSLGLHLVMATQRPAGVIKDNLRANTNLRVALRMADESDSTDVIGVKDAAFFDAETPGRGAIKIGPGRIAHFQTGYLGGRASNTAGPAGVEVRSLGFTEGEPWEIPAEPRPEHSRRTEARDIERLRDGIVAAAASAGIAPPRRPWLDELPALLDLDSLGAAHSPRDAPLIGLRDDPAAQNQHPVRIDFDEAGNVAIIGASGTGKTSALIALAASLARDARRVQLYAIDAAGGSLDTIRTLPTVGAVAPLTDAELTRRVLQRMLDIIAERGSRFAAARANSLSAYRRIEGRGNEPRLVLLLDGFAAFRQATEALGGIGQPFRMLNEIMMHGRSVGVHVVVTSDRPSAIPATMSSTLQQQFVLRLANPNDYGAAGVKGDALEDAPPGRTVAAGDSRDLQFALVGGEAELTAQAAAIERLAARLRENGIAQVPEIANAPERIPLAELPIEHDGLPVYGIDTRDFAPVTLPPTGLGVIAGPSGSGTSQAALSCLAALERLVVSRGERLDTALLTFGAPGLEHSRSWGRIASGPPEVAALAAALAEALGGKAAARRGGGIFGGALFDEAAGASDGERRAGDGFAGTPAGGERERFDFPRPGRLGVIVVERPADAEGTPALSQLTALAKAARRSGALVLFEFETGTASAVWDLYQALKQPRWGLSLQPDQGESQTPFREDLGRVKRADFPPGRGFAVEGGRVTPIHVALDPAVAEHPP